MVSLLKKIFNIIVFVTFLSSCSNTENSVDIIDLTNREYPVEKGYLSEISSGIEYVFFETTKESIFSKPKYIKFSKSYILIYDKDLRKILLFKHNGDFIRQISQEGKGPNEVFNVQSIGIDEDNDMIIVRSGDKFVKLFSIKGEFIKSFKTDHYLHYLKTFDENIVSFSMFPSTIINNNYAITIMNYDGKVVDRKLYRDPKNILENSPFSFTSFYEYRDTICFWEGYFDTIYCLTKDLEVKPRWVFNHTNDYVGFTGFSENNFFERSQTGEYFIYKFLEAKDYFFFIHSQNRTSKPLIYNKHTHEIKHYVHGSFNYSSGLGFINDLDKGYPFWPEGLIDHDRLYSFAPIYKFQEYIKEDPFGLIKNSDEIDILSTISKKDPMDNPVMIVVKVR